MKADVSTSLLSVPRISYRAWKVWRRDLEVFMKTYKVNFFPPLVEPIFYLVGLGFGLGGFVQPQEGLRYVAFIAPALVAISMMFSSFFSALMLPLSGCTIRKPLAP